LQRRFPADWSTPMTKQPTITLEFLGDGYRVENGGGGRKVFHFLMSLSRKGWLQSLANGGGLYLEDKYHVGRGAKFAAYCEAQGFRVVRA
jgi:hypothetical protein